MSREDKYPKKRNPSQTRPFVFEEHQTSKFTVFVERREGQKVVGFFLEGDRTEYTFDEVQGWCDYNGCYYDQDGNPAGWINLSEDNNTYEKYDMTRNLLEKDKKNLYYQNQTVKANDNKQIPSNGNFQEKQTQQAPNTQNNGSTQAQIDLQSNQRPKNFEANTQSKDQRQPYNKKQYQPKGENNQQEGKQQESTYQLKDNANADKYFLLDILSIDSKITDVQLIEFLVDKTKLAKQAFLKAELPSPVLKVGRIKINTAIACYQVSKLSGQMLGDTQLVLAL